MIVKPATATRRWLLTHLGLLQPVAGEIADDKIAGADRSSRAPVIAGGPKRYSVDLQSFNHHPFSSPVRLDSRINSYPVALRFPDSVIVIGNPLDSKFTL